MSRSRVFIFLLFAAAVIFSLIQVGHFTQKMTDRVVAMNASRHDQAPWALGQVEVEYHRFLTSLRSRLDFSVNADHTRVRFDAFSQLISQVRESEDFALYRENAEFSESLEILTSYLSQNATNFSVSDDDLIALVPALAIATFKIGPDVRNLILAGYQIEVQLNEQREKDATDMIFWHSVQNVVMFLVSFVLVVVLFRQEQVRRRALQQASQAKARTEAILESATDAIIVCSKTGVVSEINDPGLRMFGFNENAAVGVDLHNLLRATTSRIAFDDPRDSGFFHRERVETVATRADGSRFPVEVSLTRAETGDSDDVYVAHVRDISVRAQNERALREAHDEAKASEKAKSDLLAVMSHETRTPLNGILGAAELLKKALNGDKNLRLVSAMETSAKLLLYHVNNVLDVSRLEAGQDQPISRPFEIRELVREVVESQQARACQTGITLLAELAADLPTTVQGDAQKIRQILLNLIGNAIKFTEEGSVIVEVEILGDGPVIEFRVMDTGTGIEARQLEQVFDDFYTADSSYARKREGTGLGLGIVKRMVEAMDGDVGAESVPGEGSLFWVRVPLPCGDVDMPNAMPQCSEKPSLSILMIEDNAINRMITEQMLTDAGHHVTLAEDGETGREIARATAFDLILMDISMPGMDGIETTQKIRADSGLSSDKPIVALTAYTREQDLARVKAVGVQHILTKPLSASALEAMILKVMGDMFLKSPSQPVAEPICELLLDKPVVQSILTGLGPVKTAANLDMFADDMDQLQNALRTCTTAEDLDLDEIHRMTGSAGVLGMTKLREHLIRAEAMELGDTKDLERWIAVTTDLWQASESLYREVLATHR